VDLLGRLTFDSLPFYSAIAASGAAVTVLGALSLVAVITYFGAWRLVLGQWVTSLDHKKIGIMYIMVALVMLMRGFIDAAMMRSQQAIAFDNDGYLPPGHFDQIFSSHGTIMIFFMAMPFLSGLINLIMPQQIGSRDVAFPFMNSVSLWLTTAGAGLVLV
jgi:cytochrome o ubiquinol oxidase subunit 1